METLEILKNQEAELLREIEEIEKQLTEIKLRKQLNQLFKGK